MSTFPTRGSHGLQASATPVTTEPLSTAESPVTAESPAMTESLAMTVPAVLR
jgi:hypothetical protein